MSEVAETLGNLVSTIVSPLLDHPDDLDVRSIVEDDDNILIEIRVNEDDTGKVIGRQGRVIKSIRTLTRACASREDAAVDVELVD